MESKSKSILALTMGTLSMMVCFMVWLSLSPMVDPILDNAGVHISEFQRSFLLATPILLGSIMRIPMGILSDKYGGKKTYIALMLFLIIPVLMLPRVHSYGMLIFTALLLGMAGTSFAIGISYVTGFFPPEKQGLVLGIAGVGNIGTAFSAFFLPRFIKTMGLVDIFYILVALLVIFAILMIFCPESKTNSEASMAKSLSVAKERDTWFLALFYFLTFGMFMSMTNLLPTFMTKLFSNSLVEAGIWAAIFAVIGTLLRPVGGYLSDKIRPMTLLKYDFICLIIVAIVLGIFLKTQGIFLTIVVLIAILVGLGNGIIFKMVPFVSSGNTGAVTGFVGAMGGLGGYFPPIVLGVIKQSTGGYEIGIYLIAVVAVISLILLQKEYISGSRKIVK
ncbi:nitrate/nitrite transporter [Companilactobacillus mishanensis]|uniref:NarK/NasA family nitrate transporter n=1 Tax=Companilactobacillus mishanensis TaxID=2486008 RepID=A0A5P0ZIG6_9LACO|nr:MFS transporter [Companilactobacillus mishanensis]MQS45886.1 NarK/NasA family nitrate transporter [Companilactobacillus mishanensis]MQS52795.1 NarK/NasA family nitrate transporter [Companilactobacillus mishanensis]